MLRLRFCISRKQGQVDSNIINIKCINPRQLAMAIIFPHQHQGAWVVNITPWPTWFRSSSESPGHRGPSGSGHVWWDRKISSPWVRETWTHVQAQSLPSCALTSCLASQSLSFLIYQMKIVILSSQGGWSCGENNYISLLQMQSCDHWVLLTTLSLP